MDQLLFLVPLMMQAASAVPATQPATQAPPVQKVAAAKPASDPDKIVCKRMQKTGSLAGGERICHTRREWQELADRTRQEWQELQGTKGSTHGG